MLSGSSHERIYITFRGLPAFPSTSFREILAHNQGAPEAVYCPHTHAHTHTFAYTYHTCVHTIQEG